MKRKISVSSVRDVAEKVLSQYSKEWQELQRCKIKRFSEEISLIYKPGGVVVDLGGGDGFRAAICSQLGMTAYSADFYENNAGENDHMPDGFLTKYVEATSVARSLGVIFENVDLLSWRPNVSSVDVVMSFDTLEHLHHSPRDLLQHFRNRLSEDGLFLVSIPNATNLPKRIKILFGKNPFSTMHDWYYQPFFVGHVREGITTDLAEMADDLSLEYKIFGANWFGYIKFGHNSIIALIADFLLRPIPAFCTDIYLYGRPQSTEHKHS